MNPQDHAVTAAAATDARRSSGPVRVVYIVGAARSGSTLLSSLLGRLPGCLAVAEARLLWRRTAERRCGCGQPVAACPVWGPVLDRVAAAYGPPHAVEALQQRTIRDRHLPARLISARSDEARAYAGLLGIVYHTLAETSGAHTIVDSSKSMAEAALLRRVEGLSPVVVHLVRDPRAVAYSWQRAYRRREGEPPSALSTARDWTLENAATEALLASYPRDARTRVRYEDLVTQPDETLATLARHRAAGLGDDPTPVAAHMVGGNALRFTDRAPDLRLDVAWHSEARRNDVRSVTAVTLPLLLRYGYPVTPPSAS